MQIDGLVEEIIMLAQIPAPTFSEQPRLDWLERRLAGAPGRRSRDLAGNLIWRWGDGPPKVLVAAHVDTVFDTDTPLTVHRANGELIGPGVGDNATGVAAVVHVVETMLAQRQLAPGAVAFTVGEEGPGNLRGATAVCEELSPDAMVAVEGHWLEHVVVDALGSVRARIAVHGSGGHSWQDRDKPSATHALIELGGRLLALGTPESPVNIGRLKGGEAVNAIASAAELDVEIRAANENQLQAFAEALQRLRLGAAWEPLEMEICSIGRRPAGVLDRRSPLLEVVRSVRAQLGLPDRLVSGSTDAAAALVRRIPALCLGITTGSGMHSLGERISVEPIALGCRQLEGVLVNLLCEPPDRTGRRAVEDPAREGRSS